MTSAGVVLDNVPSSGSAPVVVHPDGDANRFKKKKQKKKRKLPAKDRTSPTDGSSFSKGISASAENALRRFKLKRQRLSRQQEASGAGAATQTKDECPGVSDAIGAAGPALALLPDPQRAKDPSGKLVARLKASYLRECAEFKKAAGANVEGKVKSYLIQSGFWSRTDRATGRRGRGGSRPQEQESHPKRMTFFDGGVARFPYSEWATVLKLRAQDILSGNVSSYENDCAHSSDGIRLFFELDYESHKGIEQGAVLRHALICQEVVKEFFADRVRKAEREEGGEDALGQKEEDLFAFWLLTTESKPKYKAYSMSPIIKEGAHVVFPNVVIDCHRGKQLCTSVAARIEKLEGYRDVIDCCYKSKLSMLRPIHALKHVECIECRNICDKSLGKDSLNCRFCKSGSQCCPRMYFPLQKFDSQARPVFAYNNDDDKQTTAPADPATRTGSAAEAFFRSHPRELELAVFETCLVVPIESYGKLTAGYRLPQGEPLCVPIDTHSLDERDGNKMCVFKQDRVNMNRMNWDKFEQVEDSAVLAALLTCVREFHPAYRELFLDEVRENKSSYYVNVRSHRDDRGTRFCRIAREEGHVHNSNRIYFCVSKRAKRVYQKCYDDACKKKLRDGTLLQEHPPASGLPSYASIVDYYDQHLDDPGRRRPSGEVASAAAVTVKRDKRGEIFAPVPQKLFKVLFNADRDCQRQKNTFIR